MELDERTHVTTTIEEVTPINQSAPSPKLNFELQKNKNKIKLISDCFYGNRKRDIVVTLILLILGLLIYRELKLEQILAIIGTEGGSGSGKTHFVGTLLENRNELIYPQISKVIYSYQVWQPKFDSFKEMGLVDEFIEGLLDEEMFKKKTGNGSVLFVIDDAMNDRNVGKLDKLFAMSRHSDASMIFLTQNFFHGNLRNITLNCDYLVVMRNPRDQSIITHIAKQRFPGQTRFLSTAYRDATAKPYSYVLLDGKQETPIALSVRARIFPHERPMIAYVMKK